MDAGHVLVTPLHHGTKPCWTRETPVYSISSPTRSADTRDIGGERQRVRECVLKAESALPVTAAIKIIKGGRAEIHAGRPERRIPACGVPAAHAT